MKKTKAILPLLALTLLVGAFLFPMTAYAQADTTPPTVTAELTSDILIVTAKDASGVEAVYINETRFSTLVNGTAAVRLKDYAGNGAQVEISATDTAGNRSQPLRIDNPYYAAATSQPTSTPAVTNTPTPTATSTPQPVVTSTPDPVITLPDPQPTDSGDEDDPAGETESAIPDGDGAFTPDGSGTVMDNATGEEGKEFFTITTAEGSVYYLVIDRQRGTENVYFLSTVTKEDLGDLAESGVNASPTQPEPQTPVSTPTPDPEPVEQPTQDAGGSLGVILFIVIAATAVGGVAYYVKIVKPRKAAAQADEYEEYDEDESESEEEEYFFDDADEYHPGEPDAKD